MKRPGPLKRAKAGTSREATLARRKLFVEAYLSNGNNGRQAAIAAGFAPQSAEVAASRLLRDVKVSAAIAARIEKIVELAEMKTENWAREVAAISFFRPSSLFRPDGTLIPIYELPDHVQAAISSVKGIHVGRGKDEKVVPVEVKLHDKNQALITMGKHLGLFERDNAHRGESLKLVVELV